MNLLIHAEILWSGINQNKYETGILVLLLPDFMRLRETY